MKSLIDACLPSIESYHDDLLVHDVKAIANYPGVPFLHFTRAWGTQILFMPDAWHESWPARGVEVPYLFATADRHHILSQIAIMAKYDYHLLRLVHYFDGTLLHKITRERAIELSLKHQRAVLAEWGRLYRKAA